jgi:hypothetical protein
MCAALSGESGLVCAVSSPLISILIYVSSPTRYMPQASFA